MSRFQLVVVMLIPLIYVGMLGAYRLGRRLGKGYLRRNPGAAESGGSSFDTAVFALLGLLVAFTFSGAGQRFDARRELIVAESNAIGTAYLRLDLLPAAVQPGLRQQFKRYTDERIALYRTLAEPEQAATHKRESEALHRSIWSQAVAGAAQLPSPAPMTLVVGALNEMIDLTSTRAMSLITHPPPTIFVLLTAISLLTMVLAGFAAASSERPSKLHVHGFVGIVSLTFAITLDMEFPREGFIRVDAADQLLIDLRRSM